MKFMARLGSTAIILLFLLIVSCNAPAMAEEPEENGFYIRVDGVRASVGGDMDGNSFYRSRENPDYHYLVPKLDDGNGFGVTIGEYIGRWAGEISFQSSSHNDVSEVFDCDFEQINLDIKYYFVKSPRSPLSLYVQAGYFVPTYIIQDGAFILPEGETEPTEIGAAEFRGDGFSGGLGLSLRLGSKLGLNGSVVFTRADLDRIKGLGKKGVPEDSFIVTNTVYRVGVVYFF